MDLEVRLINNQGFRSSFIKLASVEKLNVKTKYILAGVINKIEEEDKKVIELRKSIVLKYNTSSVDDPKVDFASLDVGKLKAFKQEMDDLLSIKIDVPLKKKIALTDDIAESLSALDISNLNEVVEMPDEEENSPAD